ncbi:MAG: TonB-dependent receptor [Mediterranea sp.]|jgi:TonB-linked SusC/RagA family outer membrane protein|nr:TonB-dependent receptor [Mediterranea sp.]
MKSYSFFEQRRTARLCLLLLLLLGVGGLHAQTLRLSGTVTDEKGEGLIGATVVVKGLDTGVSTDIDGNYSLEVSSTATLIFSYIGYNSREEDVNGRTRINVQLSEAMTGLDEVIVVGYGVQKKSSVTGAIAQVKAEDMENRTITRPEQALQGKAAGVQVIQTSGAPGSSPQVRVRGYSSNSSSSPLFVVDGVRMSNIGGIDPNDIASMEVLKDAASAAIYGAEAGNGVVLISTKRGSPGFSKISYDFQYTGQNLARIPKMLNSSQYIDYMTEGGYFPLVDIMTKWDGVTNTSWVDASFETAQMQRHNLAVEGGNDRGTYYLSLSYLNNDGIVKGNKDVYKRLTATINADYKIKNWLKVGSTNMIEKYDVKSVSENNEYGSLLAAVLQLDPLTPDVYSPDNLTSDMRNAMRNGRTLLTDENGNYYSVSQFYTSEQMHPMIMRDRSTSTNGGFTVNGSLYADFTPFKGFTFTSRFGYRLSGSNSSNFNHPYYGNATQSRDYADISGSTSTGIYYQWENFANYTHTFGKHEVGAMVGMSFQKSQSNYTTGNLQANDEHAILKNDPLFGYLNYAAASATRSVGGEENFTTKNSYFGRLNYNYGNRYFLQASLRADAADLAYLPAENRWGYFPAVSVGWDIAKEAFMANTANWLSQLKLRGSWGQNGSLAALGGYSYSTDMASSGNYPFVNGTTYVLGARPSTMGNKDLRWETSTQTDIGFDARFFNQRLSFSMDYYIKKTTDLLVGGTTPSLSIGGVAPVINAGDVENKGFEFELGWREQIGDFRYGISANMATLSNKVTFLDKSLTRIQGTTFHTYGGLSYFEEGYPVYYFRGYKVDKIDSTTGDPIFADITPDGIINEDDKTEIGDAIPSLTYGITLTAAYKGFDFVVFGTGSQGNQIFNAINRPDYPQSNKLKEIWYDGRWTKDNTNATAPRAGANDLDKYVTSDAMVYDGSFFKVKQIQLGYSLPKQLLQKAFISNLRVYVSLDDFFIFTSYPGFDPEASAGAAISAMGIDKGAYPSSRKTVIGVNVTF